MINGRWITMNGRHIFIKDGQSPMEAFIRQKGKDKKENENNEAEKFVDSKGEEHEFKKIKPKDFKETLDKAKASQPKEKAWRVDNYSHSLEDYSKDQLFKTKNGSCVAITDDGDIISVCVNNKGIKGEGRALLEFAVKHGGKKLDSYDGNFGVYNHLGFEPISWTSFNEDYAPSDWDKSRDVAEPIIFFKYTGKSDTITLAEFYEKEKESIDYDEAMSKRDKTIKGR